MSSLRTKMSHIVNSWLTRYGYAVVRLSPGGPAPDGPVNDSGYAYDNLQLTDVYAPWLVDADFLRAWGPASRNTLADILRAYELYQCVRETAMIPGDILEVGVWRGGTGAVLASAAARWKPEAKVWLCDTFSGVVKAGALDPSYIGGEHADTSKAIVAQLIADLNLENTVILQGIFPDETSESLGARPISLCHIDVDVYQSASDIVAWAAPRIASGGLLIFDDYGFSSCRGITRLVNDLRSSGSWIYFYNLNKHAILVKR